MNAHKNIALDDDCRLAIEALYPRLRWIRGNTSMIPCSDAAVPPGSVCELEGISGSLMAKDTDERERDYKLECGQSDPFLAQLPMREDWRVADDDLWEMSLP